MNAKIRDHYQKNPLAYALVFALILLGGVFGLARKALAATLEQKQFNSFVVNGATLASDPIANKYLYLLGGSDGTNYRALLTDNTGALTVSIGGSSGGAALADGTANPTTASFGSFLQAYNGATWDRLRAVASNSDAVNTSALGVLEVDALAYGFNGSQFERIRSYAGNADALAAPTLGLLGAKSFPVLFNGTTYDRMRGDANFNALVSLGTQLDGVNDTVSIRINNVIPTLDNTSVIAVSLRGKITTAGDTSVQMIAAGADALTNTVNLTEVLNYNLGFNGTTWDRLKAGGVNADTISSNTLGVLLTMGHNFAYNGTTWDRVRLVAAAGALRTGYMDGSIGTGYGVPGTAINVSATTSKVCTASNALTVGAYYWVKTSATVHYTLVADNTGACATTDSFLFNPNTEPIYVDSTSHDTLCTITDAGTATVQVIPITFANQ